MTATARDVEGIELLGPAHSDYSRIITADALRFIAGLQREFGDRRDQLLQDRVRRQREIDAGALPDFLSATRQIREGDWRVAALPADLLDRRVEITGPTDRKMVINALNSGAKAFMADFEDSNSPTWDNMVRGQLNLCDAVARTITYDAPTGKRYELNDDIATLLVRPRGWHLDERHLLVDGKPIAGSLFDFGLYFFHNVRALLERGSGPYFYLPKLQNHLEARLWNDIFIAAQDALGIPRGTIKATVLIEHILATFETDEILYELRDHSSGLNCGRWDYIFSYIKVFRNRPGCVLPNRAQITMTVPFMRAYCRNVICTCHRRGVHAMGGMAAQIPVKGASDVNEAALAAVRADKEREAGDGHDGTWVAHPGLVPIALDAFNARMPGANQIDRIPDAGPIDAAKLIEPPTGEITENGLRLNVRVGVQYLEAWLGGNGCVPLYNLMEDAATAEISRSQIWQWIHHVDGVLNDGRNVTAELFRRLLREELEVIRCEVGDRRFRSGRFESAAEIFERIATDDEFVEFLTLPGYDALVGRDEGDQHE